MKKEIYVGDRVRLSEKGRKGYPNTPSNPHYVEGTVKDLYHDAPFMYEVAWDNGSGNSYRENEIELEFSPNQTDYFDYNGELISKGDLIELIHVPASIKSELEGNTIGKVFGFEDDEVLVVFELTNRPLMRGFHPNCCTIIKKAKQEVLEDLKKVVKKLSSPPKEEETQVKTILISNINFLKINQDE